MRSACGFLHTVSCTVFDALAGGTGPFDGAEQHAEVQAERGFVAKTEPLDIRLFYVLSSQHWQLHLLTPKFSN
jgi:hypothetical protein